MTSMTSEMASKWGHLPHLRYVGNNTWHSACPKCGESGHNPSTGLPDRFFIQGYKNGHDPHGCCRRCGLVEWLDSQQIDEEKRREIEARLEKQRKAAEAKKKNRLETLKSEELWKKFNAQMTDLERSFWRNAGIPDSLQDYWGVGYVHNKKYKIGDKMYESPALSIPYLDLLEEKIVALNIQYRLLQSANENDRYRFTYGLDPVIWKALPDEAINGRVILAEGFKKGAVFFAHLVATGKAKFTVVAVPTKTPNQQMLDKLKNADEILIALDPDAYHFKQVTTWRDGKKILCNSQAEAIAKMMPDGQAKLVQFPEKIDDLIVDYGWGVADVMNTIRYARLP